MTGLRISSRPLGEVQVPTTCAHLVLRAREGDRDAFTPLMQSFEGDVRAICRRFTRDDDDAEDLVLELFVEAYLKLDQLRAPESFGPWVKSIARNHCRSWYRSQRAIPDPDLLVATLHCDEGDEGYDRVAHGVARLSQDH